MPLIRADLTFQNAIGQAISGGSIYVCSQPANTGTLPPSPLASIYSDNAGANPVTQPLVTNGFGQAFFYAASGTYTYVYYSATTGEQVYPDQVLINSAAVAVNTGIPSGAVNGSNVTFTLPSAPVNYLQLFINGTFQIPNGTNYTLVGSTITMNIAPLSGFQLYAVYQ
jgi:hypothetical protein